MGARRGVSACERRHIVVGLMLAVSQVASFKSLVWNERICHGLYLRCNLVYADITPKAFDCPFQLFGRKLNYIWTRVTYCLGSAWRSPFW